MPAVHADATTPYMTSDAPRVSRTKKISATSTAVTATGDTVVGVDARTGAERWRRPADGSVIGTPPGRVHVLTGSAELLTLDAATGAERSRFPLVAEDGATGWDPGTTYAADGYVATERLYVPEYPYPVIRAAT